MSDDKQDKVALTEDLDLEGSSADDVVGGKGCGPDSKRPGPRSMPVPEAQSISKKAVRPAMPGVRKPPPPPR